MKRRILIMGGIIIALIVIVLGVLLLPKAIARSQVLSEPVTATLPDYGADAIAVVADQRIFTLFVALNATGFEYEAFKDGMHPARIKIRAALAQKTIPNLDRLRELLNGTSDYNLVEWILQRGNPPDFGRTAPDWIGNGDPASFAGLAEALRNFYRDADVPGLWALVADDYQAALAQTQARIDQSVTYLQDYLRVSSLSLSKLVIVPNLVDSYYSGYGPQLNGTAYVVFGPTDVDINFRALVEHEMLHSIIGPMMDRILPTAVDQAQADQLFATLKTTLPQGYVSWPGGVEEMLLRAIGYRMLLEPDQRDQKLTALEDKGFLLMHTFDAALAGYEESGQSFEDYLPTLLGTLNTAQLPSK